MREPRVSFWFDLIWLIDWFLFLSAQKRGLFHDESWCFPHVQKQTISFEFFLEILDSKKMKKGRLEKNWFFTSLGSASPLLSEYWENLHMLVAQTRSVYEEKRKKRCFEKKKEGRLESNQTKAATVRFSAGYQMNFDQHFFPSFPQLFLSGNAE